MNTKPNIALAFALAGLCAAASARAEDGHAGNGSVRQDVRHIGHSIHRGVRATGHAIHQGVRATGHAVHQGVKATGHAIHRGVDELTGH